MNSGVHYFISFLSIRIKSEQLTFIRAGQIFFGFLFLLAFGLKVEGQTPTTTTLSSSPNPSCLNEAVTLTATVDQIAVTGTVNFYDGITLLGSGTLSLGVASLSISTLTAGVHNNITATYLGVAPYNGGTSLAITHTVNSPPAISGQPIAQTVGIGCTASFSVTSSGTAPFALTKI